MDKRSRLTIKLDALQRLFMINALPNYISMYIVTEYPKSGGTWIGQMLSDYLGLPFPRNQRPPLKPCIMHGHMLGNRRLKNVLCVFRDGRDVMVSWYYHRLFLNDRSSAALVQSTREALPFDDYEDIRTNLPHFIEYVFAEDACSSSPFKFTWSQFVDNWRGQSAVFTRYCDIRKDPCGELSRIITELTGKYPDPAKIAATVKKYSFENQSGRKAGEENSQSFLRKGVPGDWRNKFSSEAARVFDRLAGQQLIKLGYEPDASWVEQIVDE